MSEKIYTTDEVARICSVTVWTVREWLKSGQLVGTKRGRSYQIKIEDLRTFLEKRNG
jgi:excisionase family DNA binding protein